MDVKEFARRAEISLSLAYALVEEGRVPHRRIGRAGRRREGCNRCSWNRRRLNLKSISRR